MTASRLSEPDVLTRDQWDSFWRGSAALSSEKRLMLAVLKSALECYQKNVFAGDRQGVELFREADDWIHCDGDGSVFSYRSICETLGISATLAGGCNIGHTYTGVATLAFSSLTATLFIFLGAWFGNYLRFMRPQRIKMYGLEEA